MVLLWFAYSRTMALGYSKLSHVTGKNLFLIGNQRCGAWQVTFHFGSLRFIIPKQTSFFDVIEVLKTLYTPQGFIGTHKFISKKKLCKTKSHVKFVRNRTGKFWEEKTYNHSPKKTKTFLKKSLLTFVSPWFH